VKRVLMIVAALCMLLVVFATLVWNGTILLNHPSKDKYPVRGVDVSSHQGKIDWQTLSAQGISFAFIKATEGSGFVDPCFADNFSAARETGLRVGAYHFFSFDSLGQPQAELFIKTVPKEDDLLPPVIDIELYGEKEKQIPEATAVRRQLDVLLTALKAYYGKKPILYATKTSYDLYLADHYGEYDIWIRDVVSYPQLEDGKNWTFWQYTNRARLEGYQGEEKYIDLNVFSGTHAEWEAYRG